MNYLVDISGWAETYEELCNKKGAVEGEFYNVLDGNPFTTYMKTSTEELNPIEKQTDVVGWYKNKAELLSNVKKPNDQDVYITGISSPYTRWKATVRGVDIKWEEDGTEELKILKNYKTKTGLLRAKNVLNSEEFYSVGENAPYEIYGVLPAWEPIGSFISRTGKKLNEFANTKLSVGSVAFVRGLFYIFTEEGWKPIEIKEPIENYQKHSYVTKEGTNIKIREGFVLGTLEFYTPRT